MLPTVEGKRGLQEQLRGGEWGCEHQEGCSEGQVGQGRACRERGGGGRGRYCSSSVPTATVSFIESQREREGQARRERQEKGTDKEEEGCQDGELRGKSERGREEAGGVGRTQKQGTAVGKVHERYLFS